VAAHGHQVLAIVHNQGVCSHTTGTVAAVEKIVGRGDGTAAAYAATVLSFPQEWIFFTFEMHSPHHTYSSVAQLVFCLRCAVLCHASVQVCEGCLPAQVPCCKVHQHSATMLCSPKAALKMFFAASTTVLAAAAAPRQTATALRL
jgi:hypothetical protein